MTEPGDSLFDLSGKTAIVTGASRGIGEAVARRLAEHGASVLVSSRDLDACEEVARAIDAQTGRKAAHAAACNVSRREDVEALAAKAHDLLGRIDVVVANAAVNPHFGPSMALTDAQFDKILAANVKSVHWLAQAVLPGMAERREGAFVIMSSIAGLIGSAALGGYAVSKAAVLQLARNLAVEYGPMNVRVNCICPGIVKTRFAEALWKNPAVEAAVTERLPMRRLGEPDDIAGAAVFLASRAGAWMSGQQIVIDGGALIAPGGL